MAVDGAATNVNDIEFETDVAAMETKVDGTTTSTAKTPDDIEQPMISEENAKTNEVSWIFWSLGMPSWFCLYKIFWSFLVTTWYISKLKQFLWNLKIKF